MREDQTERDVDLNTQRDDRDVRTRTANTNNHNETGEARLNGMNMKTWDLYNKKGNMMCKWRRSRLDGARENEGEHRHGGLWKHDGLKHKDGKQGTRSHTTV